MRGGWETGSRHPLRDLLAWALLGVTDARMYHLFVEFHTLSGNFDSDRLLSKVSWHFRQTLVEKSDQVHPNDQTD